MVIDLAILRHIWWCLMKIQLLLHIFSYVQFDKDRDKNSAQSQTLNFLMHLIVCAYCTHAPKSQLAIAA
jgi:hypothetical protein